MKGLETWGWPQAWYMPSSHMTLSISPKSHNQGPHWVCPSPSGEGRMHMNIAHIYIYIYGRCSSERHSHKLYEREESRPSIYSSNPMVAMKSQKDKQSFWELASKWKFQNRCPRGFFQSHFSISSSLPNLLFVSVSSLPHFLLFLFTSIWAPSI